MDVDDIPGGGFCFEDGAPVASTLMLGSGQSPARTNVPTARQPFGDVSAQFATYYQQIIAAEAALKPADRSRLGTSPLRSAAQQLAPSISAASPTSHSRLLSGQPALLGRPPPSVMHSPSKLGSLVPTAAGSKAPLSVVPAGTSGCLSPQGAAQQRSASLMRLGAGESSNNNNGGGSSSGNAGGGGHGSSNPGHILGKPPMSPALARPEARAATLPASTPQVPLTHPAAIAAAACMAQLQTAAPHLQYLLKQSSLSQPTQQPTSQPSLQMPPAESCPLVGQQGMAVELAAATDAAGSGGGETAAAPPSVLGRHEAEAPAAGLESTKKARRMLQLE